jgi:restriction system protein
MPEKDEEAKRPDVEDAMANLISRWRERRRQGLPPNAATNLRWVPGGAYGAPQTPPYPDVLLLAAVDFYGDKTNEGQLIREVAIPWIEIIRQLDQDPEFLFKIPWRKLEEIIAGAYKQAGFPEVILTPRSGDRGRDVIATRPGIGCIRIIDQVKAYKRGHRVTADQVSSVLGVLTRDRNVSKGVVTTTSLFAPGIYQDADLMAHVPFRLELKDGPHLVQWLKTLMPGAERK